MAAPVLDLLLAAVDFSTTTLAILAVAAAFIVVLVTWIASQLVIAAVRGEVFYNGKRYSREVWESALGDVKKEMRKGSLVDSASRNAVNRFEKGNISSRSGRGDSGRISTKI